MSGIVDITSFPYTVPSGTYYIIVGIYTSGNADGWAVEIKNSAGDGIAELGTAMFTESTAYPYTVFYGGPSVRTVLIPGDVVSVINVTGMRLMEINEPTTGAFMW
ncbi:MAG: hypothetical protein QW429_04980 [Thermoprotei archaeon]